MFWHVISAATGHDMNWGAVLVIGVIYFLLYGFLGSLAGLIIGAANLDSGPAIIVTVLAGMVVFALELVFGGGFQIINIFWYFFTGRFIGAMLSGKMHETHYK